EDEKHLLMKTFNEKQITELKNVRQLPISGKFVMEVKKTIGGADQGKDLGADGL
ncbi:MAG: hypothetical protein EZS28_041635, partial [Streblomastix strix]